MNIFLEINVTFNFYSYHLNFGPTRNFFWSINNLKYIECHALGMKFPKALCPRKGKAIREKMAVDIFQ